MGQVVAGVVGAAVGWVVGGPTGAQYGYLIGSAAYGVLGPKPEGPGPGDLSAPQLQLGSPLPRVYGRVRVPVHPIAISDYRATEHPADTGKGSDPPGSFTYSLDVLGAICDGTNVLAITRQWFNKKLVYSALAESSPETIANSQLTDYYSSMQLFTGGPAQMPAPLYEDRVGAANAPANRGICSAEWGDVQCGGGKQPPMVEVEVVTAGTVGGGDILLLLQPSGGPPPVDISNYALPAGEAALDGTGVNTLGGGGQVYNPDGTLETMTWDREVDVTLEGQFRVLVTDPNVTVVFLAACGFEFGIIDDVAPDLKRYYLAYTNSSGGSQQILGPDSGGWPGPTGWFTAALTYRAATQTVAGFINGVEVLVGDASNITAAANSNIVPVIASIDDPNELQVWSVRMTIGRNRYASSGYSTPAYPTAMTLDSIPPVSPQPVTLASIISAELLLNPEVSADDFDVTELEDIEVIGYAAVGPPAQVVAELCDIHYVDIVPGNPFRFQRRGGASVATIPNADTGAGVNEPGEPFTGLKRGNADEAPAVAALSFPLLERDHEAGYERGDRLATDADDVRRIQTRVVMTAAMGKGRAITATLLDRVRRHTAQFGLSDKYAALEPADAVTAADNDGNSYRLRITRMRYADGVKECDWELDDTTALVETGLTDTDYTPSIEIVPPGFAEWLPLDIPKQRPEDVDAGYYLAVKCSDDSRVYALESANDVTYTEVGIYPTDAVFGTVTAVSGALTADGFFNEVASITVNVGDGTLSSLTRAALLADRNANVFFVGVNGRMVQGQFRTATLAGEGVYDLTGLLLGARGTERFVDDIVAGDNFCLRTTNGGIQRESRTLAQLGIPFYIKAVPQRRSAASIAGEAFTNTGVSLKPLSPVQLRLARDASTGDITGSFNRRTREDTRFGGDYGDACPLGEESERYRVRIYTSGTYATVARDIGVVTSPEFTYSGANQITDFGSHQSTVYVGIVPISATVGEQGYALQDAA